MKDVEEPVEESIQSGTHTQPVESDVVPDKDSGLRTSDGQGERDHSGSGAASAAPSQSIDDNAAQDCSRDDQFEAASLSHTFDLASADSLRTPFTNYVKG